jgi:hypothetical protein
MVKKKSTWKAQNALKFNVPDCSEIPELLLWSHLLLLQMILRPWDGHAHFWQMLLWQVFQKLHKGREFHPLIYHGSNLQAAWARKIFSRFLWNVCVQKLHKGREFHPVIYHGSNLQAAWARKISQGSCEMLVCTTCKIPTKAFWCISWDSFISLVLVVSNSSSKFWLLLFE